MSIILALFLLICTTLPNHAEEEVPQWVVAGIAAVETGSLYQDGCLIHYRDRRDGADGEVGPWQLSPCVLQDMRKSHLRDRARTDVPFSERLARTWLMHCFRRSAGDWDVAVAMYHTGPAGSARRGLRYAKRVRSAGMAATAAEPLLVSAEAKDSMAR